MNIPLFRKLQAAITAEPARINLKQGLVLAATSDEPHAAAPPCGTIGCIAGTVLALEANVPADHHGFVMLKDVAKFFGIYISESEDNLDGLVGIAWWPISEKARELLDLTADQADNLFMPGNWPVKYYPKALAGTPEYAAQLNHGIDVFIENGGSWYSDGLES